jgi:hypothetical protein
MWVRWCSILTETNTITSAICVFYTWHACIADRQRSPTHHHYHHHDYCHQKERKVDDLHLCVPRVDNAYNSVTVHSPTSLLSILIVHTHTYTTYTPLGDPLTTPHTYINTMSDDPMADFLAREKAALGQLTSYSLR